MCSAPSDFMREFSQPLNRTPIACRLKSTTTKASNQLIYIFTHNKLALILFATYILRTCVPLSSPTKQISKESKTFSFRQIASHPLPPATDPLKRAPKLEGANEEASIPLSFATTTPSPSMISQKNNPSAGDYTI